MDLAHTVNQTKIINQCSHLSLEKEYIEKIKLRIIEELSRIIMKSQTRKKREKLVQAQVIILLQILRSRQEIVLKVCNFLDLTQSVSMINQLVVNLDQVNTKLNL